ncbi:TIM barrel protein [Chloroflexota bacterium]
MEKLLFGTGGVPHSAAARATVDGIKRIAGLGLGCMEMEFVRGVKMGEAEAQLVAETAVENRVELSAHAPYYINLNAREPEKLRASQERIIQTARIASICGARSIVFHAGFYLGDPPEKAYITVKKYLGEILSQIKQDGIRVWVRPETTGKSTQFGTVEEIVNLCTELDGLAPCIDFAHLHARTGVLNCYDEFASVLEHIKQRLGRAALYDMHIHIPGIAYSQKGEIRHLNLKDSDLKYAELLKALRDYEVKGLIICESPNLEEDAMLLQGTYRSLVKAG